MASKGQIATEHLIFTGIILFLVIPLLYYSSHQNTRSPYLTDAIKTVDNTVASLSNLGGGNSDTVVVNIPGGIKQAAFEDCEINTFTKCKAVKITYGSGEEDIFLMEYFVGGSLDFFYTSGIHYVTMYNDAKNQQIVFQECGDARFH